MVNVSVPKVRLSSRALEAVKHLSHPVSLPGCAATDSGAGKRMVW